MWRPAIGAVGGAAALLALAVGAYGRPGAAPTVFHGTDSELCPFPLQVTVETVPTDQAGVSVLKFDFRGDNTVTLRNAATGRTARLADAGSYAVDTRTGNVSFAGRRIWFWSTGGRVPFLTTTSPGALKTPYYALTGARAARTVDPCALVAPSAPSLRLNEGPAPWGLPRYALSRIAAAGLVPIVGNLRRHDHVHLDVLVDGRKVTVPAGVGLAEPVDAGPCAPGSPRIGDCATGHVWVAKVANSPLHTHSTSGLVHIEPDRSGTYTLGQFFDEWGVRLDARCLGGYCTGGGKALRVFVNGKRVTGEPGRVILEDRQEIAVVFGRPSDFRSVPSGYTGGWPGPGCGGAGEHSCFPS